MTSEAHVQLLEYMKPAVEAGVFEIEATQTFAPTDDASYEYNSSTKVVVSAPRFSLDPAGVHARYPPAGAVGDYYSVFPHIALREPTLPWVRSAYEFGEATSSDDYEPWLALVVIDEDDVRRGDVVIPTKPKRLAELTGMSGFGYEVALDAPDTDPDEMVSYVSLRPDLAAQLLPSEPCLSLQAHVRRRTIGSELVREVAVVFADRMPRAGSSSFCFLVSVEGLYDARGVFVSPSSEWVHLAYLSSWGFASYVDGGKDFEELVRDISCGVLTTPVDSVPAEVADLVGHGAVAMPHYLRTSDQTYSWYRGPLSPGRTFGDQDQPLTGFPDELLIFHEDLAMFDVSYAAAFQLGKAIAIESTSFSQALYRWKQRYNRAVRRRLEHSTNDQLFAGFTAQGSPESTEDAEFIEQWLSKLALLEPVPFTNLVPAAEMLPPESVRFFHLDNEWIDALLTGAFSLSGPLRTELFQTPLTRDMRFDLEHGNLPESVSKVLLANAVPNRRGSVVSFDVERGEGTLAVGANELQLVRRSGQIVVRDATAPRRALDQVSGGVAKKQRSGVLVRSRLVSGWPDMFIDAFDGTGQMLANVRAKKLAADVLLLIFEGHLDSIEFYLRPEGLHFGLDERDGGEGNPTTLVKDVVSPRGNKREVAAHWRDERADLRLVDFERLSKTIAQVASPRRPVNAATFGMQMFEGSSKGRFTVRKQR